MSSSWKPVVKLNLYCTAEERTSTQEADPGPDPIRQHFQTDLQQHIKTATKHIRIVLLYIITSSIN
jgi:hypothetical protein